MKKLMSIMLAVFIFVFAGSALAGGRGGGGSHGRPGRPSTPSVPSTPRSPGVPGGYSGGGSHSGHRGESHHSRPSFSWHHRPSPIIIPPPCRPVIICPPRVVHRPPTYVAVVSRGVVVSSSAVSVWVSNGNGSRVEVLLTKSDGGYRGPRGEFYVSMPSEEQLRPLYAIQTETVSSPNITVWITNDNGSQTPVTLRPQGTGYLGPSNEYYAVMPTEEQLKVLYGLKSNPQTVETITVWLSDCYGTKTPVVLTKSGTDYIGPNGEYYSTLPTEEQLKPVYGK